LAGRLIRWRSVHRCSFHVWIAAASATLANRTRRTAFGNRVEHETAFSSCAHRAHGASLEHARPDGQRGAIAERGSAESRRQAPAVAGLAATVDRAAPGCVPGAR
jgi:hypothetical protein